MTPPATAAPAPARSKPMALLLLLVLGCLATAGARAPDLSHSTSAASATSESELSCVEQCTTVPENVSKNDTCLYVTVLDQFGDGWPEGLNLTYWSEAAPAVSVTPTCRCPRIAGCIRPSQGISQQIHLTVGTVSRPSYFWEVYWSVQVVEGGEWKNKYYGGYNTNFVFNYSQLTSSFVSPHMVNAWIPETNMSCGIIGSSSFLKSRWYADSSGLSRPYSTAEEVVAYTEEGRHGYHDSVWVITDMMVCTGLKKTFY